VVDNKFVGLAIDHVYQGLLTDARIASWLEQIKPLMLEKIGQDSTPQSVAL